MVIFAIFDVSNCKLQVYFKQKSIIDNLDTLELNFFLQIGVTSSVLFVWSVIRYHNTREVATHKIRNTVTQGEGYDQQPQQQNDSEHSGCIR